MPLIAARGLDFHVQELGPAGGERPALVMLHGLFIGSLASWYFTAAPALAADRRVLLYDLRGHGRSERATTGYDVASMAEDLAAVAARLGDRPLDLAGHSFGALVALRFALDRPGRTRRLALIEAPLPPARFGELEGFAARTPEAMIEALPEALRAVVAGRGRRGSRLLESLAFLATGTSLLEDLRREPDIDDADLARVTCPVLCVYGDRSACRPVGDRLARAIPAARLEVLPGGHFLHVEAEPQLTRALAGFFDG